MFLVIHIPTKGVYSFKYVCVTHAANEGGVADVIFSDVSDSRTFVCDRRKQQLGSLQSICVTSLRTSLVSNALDQPTCDHQRRVPFRSVTFVSNR